MSLPPPRAVRLAGYWSFLSACSWSPCIKVIIREVRTEETGSEEGRKSVVFETDHKKFGDLNRDTEIPDIPPENNSYR